jgi:hypothetical protein
VTVWETSTWPGTTTTSKCGRPDYWTDDDDELQPDRELDYSAEDDYVSELESERRRELDQGDRPNAWSDEDEEPEPQLDREVDYSDEDDFEREQREKYRLSKPDAWSDEDEEPEPQLDREVDYSDEDNEDEEFGRRGPEPDAWSDDDLELEQQGEIEFRELSEPLGRDTSTDGDASLDQLSSDSGNPGSEKAPLVEEAQIVNSFYINDSLIFALADGKLVNNQQVVGALTGKIRPRELFGLANLIVGLQDYTVYTRSGYGKAKFVKLQLNMPVSFLSTTLDGLNIWIQSGDSGYLYDVNFTLISTSTISTDTIVKYGLTAQISGSLNVKTHVLTLSSGQILTNIRDFVIDKVGQTYVLKVGEPGCRIILTKVGAIII